jgi:protein-S-isoprenylcysteine O-methyltransferase Ste14
MSEQNLSPLIRYGNFLFRWRNTLFPIIMLGLLIGITPGVPGGTSAGLWSDFLGLAIVIGGAVLRGVVVGMEYIKRGGLDKKVYANDLVTGGMFAHGRNPLYVGNLMIVFGTFVIHGSLWVVLLGSGYFIFSYIAIVAAEENFLRGKFGPQYDEYCATTPRWGIRFAGLGETLGGYVFNWRRVIAKEYTTDATAILTILVVLGYEQITKYGVKASTTQLEIIAGAIISVGLLTLAIRAMKKSGRLREESS